MPIRIFTNALLAALPPDSLARLALRPINFQVNHEMEYPGRPIRNLFFLEEGMASITTTFANGSQVEVGMCGFESVIGASAMMGTKLSLNRIYTQVAGRGYGCSVEAARTEFALGGAFQAMVLASVQAQLVSTMQSVGCNAKHDMEQRLSRWLLLCADRVRSDKFLMSHQFLADMLGSSRPTVSLAAAILKDEGLILYSRGKIHILNTPALEHRSCECYAVVKEYLGSAQQFDHKLTPAIADGRVA